MNFRILLIGIYISTLISCRKDQPRCRVDDFQGIYTATFIEASGWSSLPDPYEAKFSIENSTTIILDYHPDMGFDTKIEIGDGIINIPPQIWTSENILTSDSSKHWQLELTGSGTCQEGKIELEYTRNSNFYNSNTFEYHSSGKMVFEPKN